MSHHVIWAPWRMSYILDDNRKNCRDGCLFCRIAAENNDGDNLILFRGTHAFVLLNRYPYNNGHLMVVPYSHLNNLGKLSQDAYLELMELFRRSIDCLHDALQADGFNGGINLGKTAGAGIADHLHFHIVPRWHGDYNFMPVIGETKVMPQHLEETYNHLLPYFSAERMASS
ncbi:MAG: HIT domain-containing protein [Deltaproteobacteria bacterium]|nr:HIT domain-containing protein [Candidatus Anaeroferrophillus wilburensis]MBN2888289.1 HIT domain-containing protein [Deltaproteobacteria bacterium]